MKKNRFRQIGVVLETIKFSHSVFALPFALFATVVAAGGWPAPGKLVLVIACMVFVRSTAMSFNRLADEKFDAANPRTADRALPAGRLSRRALWRFTGINAAGAVVVCALFPAWYGNPYPLVFIAPLLVYVCGYSYAKRFTWLCHYWLGSVLGLAAPAGFIAVDPGALSIGVALLGLAVAFWTAGFDIIYSLLDVDYDRRERLYSLPSRFGVPTALRVARITHVAAFGCFLGVGLYYSLTFLYPIGLGVTAALLVIEHRLVRPPDLSKVNIAFFTVNGLLSIFLSGLGVIDVLVRSAPLS